MPETEEQMIARAARMEEVHTNATSLLAKFPNRRRGTHTDAEWVAHIQTEVKKLWDAPRVEPDAVDRTGTAREAFTRGVGHPLRPAPFVDRYRPWPDGTPAEQAIDDRETP